MKSFTTDGRMFVIFNEDKVIDESAHAHGQLSTQKIPRIAHLCLNDRGASLNSLRNIWTTYLKSRLVCVHDLSRYRKSTPTATIIEQMNTLDESASIFQFDEISKWRQRVLEN